MTSTPEQNRAAAAEHASSAPTGSRKKLASILLGPAAAALMLALPAPTGLDPAAWRVAAVAVLMAIWWVGEALPVAATALLPLALFPLLGITPIADVAAPYANPLIFLFLGGFIIALAIEKWNLHRRVALLVLVAIGSREDRQIGGFMLATAFLSMWVSNTATTIMMLPVALSIIPRTESGEIAPAKRGFAVHCCFPLLTRPVSAVWQR
jgi:sodium-dependent dicarboxylate transporter 2/3/5